MGLATVYEDMYDDDDDDMICFGSKGKSVLHQSAHHYITLTDRWTLAIHWLNHQNKE